MTEAELRTMIDEGKSLDEIASEMAAGEYDVCSRETLLSYAISEIENDRLFLARHILDAVDSGEEVAIAVCEDGDFGSGDRAIVCVTRWDGTQQRFRHRVVRVAVKGNEIHLVSNTVDRFVGTIE